MAAPNQFGLPAVSATSPSYADIMKLLQAPRATMTGGLPEIQQTLGAQAPELERQVAGVGADIMGAMGKRGMTGSSIEAQALARGMGGMRTQFAAQTAPMLAQLIERARAGDIQAQQQMMFAIAQAMGQEMTAQREMQMFREQLDAMQSAAAGQRKSSLWGAGLGAIGQIGGSALGAYFGGPMGATAGGQLGSKLGDMG